LTVTTATNVTGVVAVANGGTGAATANLGRVALNRGAVALTSGATVNTDCALGNVFTLTLGANATLANPTNMVAGATYIWEITQDATGSRTLAYGNAFTWIGGTALALTTTANGVDIISAVYTGTKLRAGSGKGFA
jgi:hypothetical protein